MTAGYNYGAGTDLVNAIVTEGEHLSSNLNYYTLNTLNALTETQYSAVDAGQNLIRTLEIIQLGAQAVILSVRKFTAVDLTSSTNRATYGMGTSIDGSSNSGLTSATIYQLRFTIEHDQAWLTTGTSSTIAGSLAGVTIPVSSVTSGTLAYALNTETTSAALPFATTIYSSTTLAAYTFTVDNSATGSSSLVYSNVL